MTRRSSFLAGIFGALGLPTLAQEQSKYLQTTTSFEQVYSPPQWAIPLDKNARSPKNNQCPVCGTMADPYVRPSGTSLGITFNLIRCKRCNAAFFQDAEK